MVHVSLTLEESCHAADHVKRVHLHAQVTFRQRIDRTSVVDFVFEGVRPHVATRSYSEPSQSAVQSHLCVLFGLVGAHVAPVCDAATSGDEQSQRCPRAGLSQSGTLLRLLHQSGHALVLHKLLALPRLRGAAVLAHGLVGHRKTQQQAIQGLLAEVQKVLPRFVAEL